MAPGFSPVLQIRSSNWTVPGLSGRGERLDHLCLFPRKLFHHCSGSFFARLLVHDGRKPGDEEGKQYKMHPSNEMALDRPSLNLRFLRWGRISLKLSISKRYSRNSLWSRPAQRRSFAVSRCASCMTSLLRRRRGSLTSCEGRLFSQSGLSTSPMQASEVRVEASRCMSSRSS
jgi:hypothetical protein